MAVTVGIASCSAWSQRSVSVLATWTGTEETDFKKVLEKFTEKTGIEAVENYQGTRAVTEVLLSNVQKGSPPDVAIISSPNELATYARNGNLVPLNDKISLDVQRKYSRQWLLPLENNKIYAVPIKANLKSIIWYNREHPPKNPPRTWNELVSYTRAEAAKGRTPWCMGMGDAPTSGWPGTDWVEDILLHQAGTDAYQKWALGELPWTSSEVKAAWRSWGEIVAQPKAIKGGTPEAMIIDFKDAGTPMFSTPQECTLEHQASFFPTLHPFSKPNFFSFPEFGSFPGSSADQRATISIDQAGLFNDTPQAQRLIEFLATEEAQKIWPEIPGNAYSLNVKVGQDIYSTDIGKRVAGILASGDSTLCYDAADLMPAEMRNAFNRAVLTYLSNPRQLPELLQELERIRTRIPKTEWLDSACQTEGGAGLAKPAGASLDKSGRARAP